MGYTRLKSMARTLFFIEALLFAALGLGGALLATDLRAAFLAPFALSLVVPLACALAVWPAGQIAAALRKVFSAPGAMCETGEEVHVLESLAAFCGRAAVAGTSFALASALPRLIEGKAKEEWGLLGAYLALYSLLNAVAARSMAKVASRAPARAPAPAGAAAGGTASTPPSPPGEFPASAYGLTPRESEVASLIAGGSSYKETAYRLGISIKTVKTHVAHVYEKTGCASNVGLSLLLRSDEAGRGTAEEEAGPPAQAAGPPHTKGR
jgi:DNA-binding CsgD family transcriptional regulator